MSAAWRRLCSRPQSAEVLGTGSVDADNVRQLWQTAEPAGSTAFARLEARFQDRYSWTIDLPGRYFLEAAEKLYKRNELATGALIALGQQVNLATVTAPVFLLAARDDELVAPPQLFAAEHLVGIPACNVRKAFAPCRHVGRFIGKAVLDEVWPSIVRWIGEPMSVAPPN